MFYFLGISISAELKVGIPSAQRVVTIGNILIPLLGKLAWGNLLQQGWKEGKHTTKLGVEKVKVGLEVWGNCYKRGWKEGKHRIGGGESESKFRWVEG